MNYIIKNTTASNKYIFVKYLDSCGTIILTDKREKARVFDSLSDCREVISKRAYVNDYFKVISY